MVPRTGIEPARLAALDPKSSASANFATSACEGKVESTESDEVCLADYLCRYFLSYSSHDIFMSPVPMPECGSLPSALASIFVKSL